MHTLTEDEKKACLSIGQKLQLFENLNSPIYCNVTNKSQGRGIDIPRWKEYEVEESFEIQRKFDITIHERIKKIPSWANRPELYDTVKTNIKNRRNIARSTTIPINDNKSIFLTQNVNGKCVDNKLTQFRTNFSYKNENNDFTLISGLGNPVDVFSIEKRTYLAGYYERNWDDSHKYKYKVPQPMIYIYKMNELGQSNKIYFSMLCRFIYEN